MGRGGGISLKKRLMSFAFQKTPRISLSYKLVPVLYREYEFYFQLQFNKLHQFLHKDNFSSLGLFSFYIQLILNVYLLIIIHYLY